MTVDEKQAKEMERKIRRATFDLEDFLEQFQSVKKMGFAQIMEMIPGFSQMKNRLPNGFDEKQLVKFEAIIRSMTPSRAPRPGDTKRPPAPPHRPGQRHHTPGREPAPEPVPPGAETDETDV